MMSRSVKNGKDRIGIVRIVGRTGGNHAGYAAGRTLKGTQLLRDSTYSRRQTENSLSGEGKSESRQMLFLLRELDCPHCSELIASDLRGLEYIEDVSYNILTRTLTLKSRTGCIMPEDLLRTVTKVVKKHEPDVLVEPVISDHESISSGTLDGKAAHGSDLKGRLAASVILFASGLLFFYAFPGSEISQIISRVLLLAAYLLSGFDVLRDAFRKIRVSFFSEQMLMTIASLGAWALDECPEAAAIMIFYQIGEYFQRKAVNRSRASIKTLLDICPDTANLETEDGIKKVRASLINVGDRVVVRPGEKIPCDGIVTAGYSDLDTSNLTGESVPRFASVGDEVYSGYISKSGIITIEVRKTASDSAAADIVRMVETAWEKKSKTENFISVFARYYTPAVVALAAVTALIPPLFFACDWSVWIERSLIFLVVSCPCALVISVPLTYFSGIGLASRHGIMVKGSCYLDVMARLGTVFFDKTGTLTQGAFKLSRIICNGRMSEEHILQLACSAEQSSVHPVAQSILKEAENRGIAVLPVDDFAEEAGMGIRAVIDGRKILVGNSRLFAVERIDVPRISETGTVVHVAESGKYCGSLLVSDEIKPDSFGAIKKLKSMGLSCIMLTGDNDTVAYDVAGKLGMSGCHASLFPDSKVTVIEEKLRASSGHHAAVAFVGDGINDAPALAVADVGISMGAMGSDAAIEAADAVIMSDEPAKLVTGIRIARRTRATAVQNIVLALSVKFLLMITGTLGLVSMWFAVFGDVGIMIIAVLNAMRILFDRGIADGSLQKIGPSIR